MLTAIDIKQIVREGESLETEFKEFLNLDDVGPTICAFANDYNRVRGGKVFVGVNAKGQITGVPGNSDALQRETVDLCRNNCAPAIGPKVYSVDVEGKQILVIEVSALRGTVYRFKGICYIRLASTTRKATPPEMEFLEAEAGRLPFDHYIHEDASVDDLSVVKFESYIQRHYNRRKLEPDNRSTADLFEHLGFVKHEKGKNKSTNAALLMFGKLPQSFFPMSGVNAVRFRGVDITSDILDRREIKGTLDEVMGGSLRFVEQYIAAGSSFARPDAKRLDIMEYPLWALREAIANAVTHRDYRDPGQQVDLKMFDDRIEILSPGPLGGGLTLEDLGTGKRWLRNPKIAEVLYDLEWIEKMGTGIARMRKEMRDNGSPEPVFKADHNSVSVTLPAHPSYSARRMFEEGVVAKDNGDYEKAKSLFKSALQLRPGYVEVLNAWGVLEGEEGNLQNARLHFKEAIELKPNYIQPYLSWASLEQKHASGSVGEARSIYKQAIRVNNRNPFAWKLWALLERKHGDYDKAAELFSKAIELEPWDATTWQAWGQMELKRGDFRTAEKYLQKAQGFAREDYSRAWILSDLARTMQHLRYPADEIERCFERSLSLNSNSAETLRLYAAFLESLGKKQQAAEAVRRAQALGWRRPPSRRGGARRPGGGGSRFRPRS